MNNLAFIVGLMKTETDALGFIPSSAIRDRWIKYGRYIIQRNARGRRLGYLLHGPAKPGRPMHVNQVCIEYDYRLQGYAILAVRELLNRALAGDCSEIRLRCATDLTANHFWKACGFELMEITPGGKRRGRSICHYRIHLQKDFCGETCPPMMPIRHLSWLDSPR